MASSILPTTAEEQFHVSSERPFPADLMVSPWKIRNDYPKPYDIKSTRSSNLDTPWTDYNPSTQPGEFLEAVKKYCLDGMIESDFVPQNNQVRDWYHAPWMHKGPSGREPLRGLTSERYLPPREFSAMQQRTTQTWAVGFFNFRGATILGEMWANPSAPNWTKNIYFPEGTCIFKLLYNNATNEELPILKSSPRVQAIIAVQPTDNSAAPNPNIRAENPQTLRLLQMDIAVRDDRSTTGWVWGTFMWSSSHSHIGSPESATIPSSKHYNDLIPVGLSWGDDPDLTQEAYDNNDRPKETWINPVADAVRKSLRGGRPFWGWNERLNGPADNFISACQSCHSTAQWKASTNSQGTNMVPPAPVIKATGQFVSVNDDITMSWFQNTECGTTIAKDGSAISADNSLQLMIGYENYLIWKAANDEKMKIPVEVRQPMPKLPPPHRRQGPDMGF